MGRQRGSRLLYLENRMEKDPEVRYHPVTEQAPLGDYAAIGETTQFEVDAEGYLLIFSPAERLQLRSMASSVFGSSGLLWIRQQIENGCRYLPGMIMIAAASGTACAHDVIVIIPFLK